MTYPERRPMPAPEHRAETAHTPATSAPTTLSWTAALVVIAFVLLATVLFALGHPASAVIGLLGGAAAIAVEAIRRIGGRP